MDLHNLCFTIWYYRTAKIEALCPGFVEGTLPAHLSANERPPFVPSFR
jgi:hypothetical protein